MATDDMRISLNFVDHPKVRKIIRTCGYEAFYSLMKLFSIAGRLYPDGDLIGLDNDDIEDIAGWTGEQGKFVDTLVHVNFLDISDKEYSIHDWEDHQPWLMGSEDRSEHAKKAAEARWGNKKKAQKNAQNADLCSSDAQSIQGAMPEQCPSTCDEHAPSLSPTPTYNTPLDTKVSIPPTGGDDSEKQSSKPKKQPKKKTITIAEASSIISTLDPDINLELYNALRDLVKNRQDIKKPMTKLALEQTVGILKTKLETDQERIDCIRLSIANGWQGLFPEQIVKKRSNGPPGKPSQRTLGNKDRWDEFYAKEDAKHAANT